jgi:hypothetical protein
MHLQSDETFAAAVVDDVRDRAVIDPHAQSRADGFHAVVVPLAELVQRLGRRVGLAGREPAALRFLVDLAAPLPRAGIDVRLVTVHAAVLEFRGRVTAELHAGVHRPHVLAHVELQDEVAVGLLRDQEAVGSIGHRGADDGAVHHLVLGRAAELLPALERLAVEQRRGIGGHDMRSHDQKGQRDGDLTHRKTSPISRDRLRPGSRA